MATNAKSTYALKYYYEKIRNNPEEKAKRAEYHAKWQRENKDKWNAYHNEYRRRRRITKGCADNG